MYDRLGHRKTSPALHTRAYLAPIHITMVQGSQASIWLRNVQLGAFGFFLGLIGVWQQDGAAVTESGFFQGYSMLVWTVITVNAAGGLIIAVVVKYADNILKGTWFQAAMPCHAGGFAASWSPVCFMQRVFNFVLIVFSHLLFRLARGCCLTDYKPHSGLRRYDHHCLYFPGALSSWICQNNASRNLPLKGLMT